MVYDSVRVFSSISSPGVKVVTVSESDCISPMGGGRWGAALKMLWLDC